MLTFVRHLHVRLLLLRPILSNYVTSDFHRVKQSTSFEGSLSGRIFLQCAVVCVQVAQEAIETIYREKGTRVGDVGSLSAWWYNVLFLYTAATVLIAARLSSPVLAQVSEESILDAWRKSMEILMGYKIFGKSICRLTTTLRLLFDAVPHQYSRLRQNPQRTQASTVPGTEIRAPDSTTFTGVPTTRQIGFSSSPFYAPVRDPAQEHANLGENNDFSSIENPLDFGAVFDPTDLSWLMTIPLDS
jgi:hypothetical protein